MGSETLCTTPVGQDAQRVMLSGEVFGDQQVLFGEADIAQLVRREPMQLTYPATVARFATTPVDAMGKAVKDMSGGV
ncbi:MAG: hypothetical protein AAFN59_10640 [Pseudomonadota bacterium]